MASTVKRNEVWKKASLVRAFLEGVRERIPFGAEQIEVMLRVSGCVDVDGYFKAFELAVFGGRRPA
ncbi:MAG: hypothetical protein ACE5I7_01315 [Candidatus Binatia bacterium]